MPKDSERPSQRGFLRRREAQRIQRLQNTVQTQRPILGHGATQIESLALRSDPEGLRTPAKDPGNVEQTFSEPPAFEKHPGPTVTFRVPSPTDSEEEELETPAKGPEAIRVGRSGAFMNEDSLPTPDQDALSLKISQLGESKSLFSETSPEAASRSDHAQAKSAAFTFGGSISTWAPVFTPTSSTFANNQTKSRTTARGHKIHPRPRQRLSGKMVNERVSPNPTATPQKPAPNPFEQIHKPEFGKASSLQPRVQPSIFNVPDAHKPRPEHHRPQPPPADQSDLQQPKYSPREFINPFQPRPPVVKRADQKDPDVVEIRPPAGYAPYANFPPPRPVYSSNDFASSTGFKQPGNLIDLTKTRDTFEPILLEDRFGAADPYTYVDSAKANEDIKALLEGAFEDDEDKPRTRSRKTKSKGDVAGLADDLDKLGVKTDKDGVENVEEEQEDEDDGSVEGLNVKLLPHQVAGVEWMRDKETGKKKKSGINPKGGILADDVREFVRTVFKNADSCRWVSERLFNRSPLSSQTLALILPRKQSKTRYLALEIVTKERLSLHLLL